MPIIISITEARQTIASRGRTIPLPVARATNSGEGVCPVASANTSAYSLGRAAVDHEIGRIEVAVQDS
jgi:hypothetical protein